MKTKFETRTATTSDIPALNELYQETILTVNRVDYSKEEVEDWASCGNDSQNWEELINNFHLILAENQEKHIVGFAAIGEGGYLHMMFIHKAFQRQGIASLLYNRIEEYAIAKGITRIFSEVSITAKGFFEKQGFKVDEEQKRRANKLSLVNYKMSKIL